MQAEKSRHLREGDLFAAPESEFLRLHFERTDFLSTHAGHDIAKAKQHVAPNLALLRREEPIALIFHKAALSDCDVEVAGFNASFLGRLQVFIHQHELALSHGL